MSARKVNNLRNRATDKGHAKAFIAGGNVEATRGVDGKIRFRMNGSRISYAKLIASAI